MRPDRGDKPETADFELWRNLRFKRAVLDALKSHKRYAGMGGEHLQYLRGIAELDQKVDFFDMAGARLGRIGSELSEATEATEQLRRQVPLALRSPAPASASRF